MYFDYDRYYSGCLFLPIAFDAVMIPASIFMYFVNIKEIFQATVSVDNIFILIIWSLFMVPYLYMQLKLIYKRGIYLFHEKEIDAVRMHGYISAIRDLYRAEGYQLSGLGYWMGTGVQFTINDIKCVAIVQGTLKVGYYVTVKYLPKSGFILHISKLNEESSIDGNENRL